MRSIMERLEGLGEEKGWRTVVAGSKAPDMGSFERVIASEFANLGTGRELYYMVVDVKLTPKEGKPFGFKISGSNASLLGWFTDRAQDAKQIDFRIITITRDRNVSRKFAEEV